MQAHGACDLAPAQMRDGLWAAGSGWWHSMCIPLYLLAAIRRHLLHEYCLLAICSYELHSLCCLLLCRQQPL